MVAVYLILLGWLTLAAAGSGTVWWDRPVQRDVRMLDGPEWGVVADIGNWLGVTVIGLVILAAIASVCILRHRLTEAALLGGVALIRSLNWPIKWLVDSPRPATNAQGTNDVASGLGYPSGHAMGTMLIGGALVVVVFRLAPSPGARVVAVLLATAAILACGYARVVTLAHWPSDVAGAWLWGIGLLGVVLLVTRAIERRSAARRDPRPASNAPPPPPQRG